MKSLIVKDFLLSKKSFNKYYQIFMPIVLLAAVFLLPKEGILYVAVCLPVFAAAFPMELNAAERKSDWDKYLLTLPVSRSEIVLSRYVFCGLSVIVSLVAVVFLGILSVPILGVYTFAEIGWFSLGGLALGLLYMVLSLPLGYIFEGEMIKGATMGAVCLLVVSLLAIRQTSLLTFLVSCNYATISIAAIAVMLILIYVSYRVSLFGYRKRNGIKG